MEGEPQEWLLEQRGPPSSTSAHQVLWYGRGARSTWQLQVGCGFLRGRSSGEPRKLGKNADCSSVNPDLGFGCGAELQDPGRQHSAGSQEALRPGRHRLPPAQVRFPFRVPLSHGQSWISVDEDGLGFGPPWCLMICLCLESGAGHTFPRAPLTLGPRSCGSSLMWKMHFSGFPSAPSVCSPCVKFPDCDFPTPGCAVPSQVTFHSCR